MYIFPDAVSSSILIIAGNSPVIWTQYLEAFRATYLVDVSGGWPMVFHNFREMWVMPKAVSICNRTEWLFSFSDTYFRLDFELGRKVATRLFVCFSFPSVLCGCLCVVLCTGEMQNPSLYSYWLHSLQWCILSGLFRAKSLQQQFQQTNGGFFCVELGGIEY